jgi:hypothetical protein
VSSINRALAKLRFADSDSVTWERSVEGLRAHVRFPATPHAALSTGGSGGGSNVYPATIGAKVSGVKYACTVYKNGKYDDDGNLKSDGVAGSVFVIQVGTSETIPVGTWIMVAEFGGHYEGAIPIWL